MLGFFMTYPLYRAGGIWLALPTTVITVLLVTLLSVSVINHRLGGPLPDSITRILLVFVILFSMPFGMLSLPLLLKMSTNSGDHVESEKISDFNSMIKSLWFIKKNGAKLRNNRF